MHTNIYKALLLLSAVLAVPVLMAHEYILLASAYRVKKGDKLELRLFVADGFNIEAERPYQEKITRRFGLVTNTGTTDIGSNTPENALPITKLDIDFDGSGLFHLQRDYARITMQAAKFREYLKEDHIENITISRQETKPQNERYTRYIKCLVQSDPLKTDTLYKKNIGHTFEIILLQNPYQLHTGTQLQARVLFNGQPLAGKVITARNRKGSLPASMQTARTGTNGICTFKITRGGEWFIHATHMIPCADKNDADWESFWASYSFGIDQ